MASGKSTLWASALLDLLLGAVPFTTPGVMYLALFTAAPISSGGGTEASGGGYARCPIPNNLTNWPASIGGQKVNGAAFAFAGATGDWSSQAPMVAAGLFDALTLGNMYYFGSLLVNKPVFNGSQASFAPGSITIVET